MSARILFVHNHPATFVRTDLALLGEEYDVREWHQRTRTFNLPALARAVAQSDLVYGWFASWHTFVPLLLARWLRRPSLLVVGGYDTAALPEIGYGSQRGGIKRWVARATMRMASRLIAVSEASRQETIRNTGIAADKIVLIYHGVHDCECELSPLKEAVALTVGNVERDNLQRKGLEPFVRAAALLPEVPFVLIGAWRDRAIDDLRAVASPNVQFTGWLTEKSLRDYYAQAQVYVQASRHEAFGLAVAEAMSFECVPVVTRCGALPEVVGDAGVYLDSAEPHAIRDGVRRALSLDATWGLRARARIAKEFSLERRREKLQAQADEFIS